MSSPADLASRLLRFEQQLRAYERLHADELAELWQALNACKQEIASARFSGESGGPDSGAHPAAEEGLTDVNA